MQKVFNALTVISFAILTVGTAAGVKVYLERDKIIDAAKEEITSMIMGTVSNMDLDLPESVIGPIPDPNDDVVGIPAIPFGN